MLPDERSDRNGWRRGTNNFIASGGDVTIFIAGTSVTNCIGGGGPTEFIAASRNSSTSFLAANGYNEIYLLAGDNSVAGGSSYDLYILTGGTNSVDLGSGYSTVFDLGGNNQISGGSTGLVLDLDGNPASSVAVGSNVEVIDPVGV
jgi:hypothetical protein